MFRPPRPGYLNIPIAMNIVVGIVGAAIGGAVVGIFGGGGVTGFNLWSLIVAVLGAALLLAAVNFFTRKR